MNYMKNIQSKLQLVALLLIGGATQLWAEDKVAIADFTISAGQTVTLEVELNNEQDAYSLMANVKLPQGLTYVDKSAKKTSRVTGRSSKANFDLQADGTYQIWVQPASSDTKFVGEDGAVMTFDVKASEILANTTTITIDRAYYVTKVDGAFQDIELPNATTTVTCRKQLPGVNTLTAENDKLDIKVGETKEINIVLTNEVPLASLQGMLTLPAGLTLVDAEAAEDGSVFGYTDRIPAEMTMTVYEKSESVWTFVVSSLEAVAIEAGEGTLFSVAVKADEALEAGSEIVFSGFRVGNSSAESFQLDDVITVTVGDPTLTGINSVESLQGAAEYYSLSGVRMSAPAKGVAIARMADGTARKVRF